MLLSLIIPMYNAAATVCRCLDSIGQHADMEVILVDDGSTDDTYEVCCRYAEGGGNYKLLQQKNGGPQSAINHALAHAEGTYVGFVDSDDTVDAQFYQTLRPYLLKEEQDVIAFSYLRIDEAGNACENKIGADGVYTGEALLDLKKRYLVNGTMQFSKLTDPGRWNKVFKNELLQKQKQYFDEAYRLGEDILMTTACMLAAHNVLCLSDAFLYHYIDTPNSLSKYVYEDYWEKFCRLIKRIGELYELYRVPSERLAGMYVYFGKAIIKKMAHQSDRKTFAQKSALLLDNPGFIAGLDTVERSKLSFKEKVFCCLLKRKSTGWIHLMLKNRK